MVRNGGERRDPPCRPRFDELPEVGGTRSAWGLFGDDESVGQIALLSADRVVSAAALVRSGRVFSLNAPVDTFAHGLFGRKAPRHTVLRSTPQSYDDLLDSYYPQSSSQWDSLAHVGRTPGVFYNGATSDDVESARRNTIDHWALSGIVGRGILLDVARFYQETGRGVNPGSHVEISPEDLEATRRMCGIECCEGDILMFHTGYLDWYRDAATEHEKRDIALSKVSAIGIEQSEAIVRWLWDSGACAIVCDAPAVEALPQNLDSTDPYAILHRTLIGQLGFGLGELWDLGALAVDCAADGVYEFLVTSAPLHVVGGIGSPANALAIK